MKVAVLKPLWCVRIHLSGQVVHLKKRPVKRWSSPPLERALMLSDDAEAKHYVTHAGGEFCPLSKHHKHFDTLRKLNFVDEGYIRYIT